MGMANLVMNQIIADRVPLDGQGAETGCKQCGVQAGVFLAGLTLPAIAGAASWRLGFLLFSGLSLLAFVLSRGLGDVRIEGRRVIGRVRPTRLVLLLLVYSLFMGYGMSAVNAFLPLYAFDRLGFSGQLAGLLVAIIALNGFLFRIGMGYAGDRVSDLIPWLAGMALLALLAIVLGSLSVTSSWLIWIGAIVFGATAAAWNTAAMVQMVREGPHAARLPDMSSSDFSSAWSSVL